MESIFEIVIKFVVVAILVLSGLLYWLLPKTRLAKSFRMNESLFVFTSVIGMMCGLGGLLATFIWPSYIVEWHLWELLIMPFVIINVYWGIIIRARKTMEILDEKQVFDISNAAAITWAFSIPAMVILFVLYQKAILSGIIWFPYFVFVTLFFFSISTLYCFKRI